MEKERIVIVDDNPTNLTSAKEVLYKQYEVFTFNAPGKMFTSINEIKPALILLDIDMPVMDGFRTLELLKNSTATRNIPVIFLTGLFDVPTEIKGLKKGAVDYITKPFVPELLLQRVEMHILIENQKRALQIQKEELEKQRYELSLANDKLKEMLERDG
jgi:DNA-binding response OmpR family regulator